MEIKEITIQTKDRIIKVTEEVITIKDLGEFTLLEVMPNKLKVKREMKILKI